MFEKDLLRLFLLYNLNHLFGTQILHLRVVFTDYEVTKFLRTTLELVLVKSIGEYYCISLDKVWQRYDDDDNDGDRDNEDDGNGNDDDDRRIDDDGNKHKCALTLMSFSLFQEYLNIIYSTGTTT